LSSVVPLPSYRVSHAGVCGGPRRYPDRCPIVPSGPGRAFSEYTMEIFGSHPFRLISCHYPVSNIRSFFSHGVGQAFSLGSKIGSVSHQEAECCHAAGPVDCYHGDGVAERRGGGVAHLLPSPVPPSCSLQTRSYSTPLGARRRGDLPNLRCLEVSIVRGKKMEFRFPPTTDS